LHFPIVSYTGHGHMLLTGFIHWVTLATMHFPLMIDISQMRHLDFPLFNMEPTSSLYDSLYLSRPNMWQCTTAIVYFLLLAAAVHCLLPIRFNTEFRNFHCNDLKHHSNITWLTFVPFQFGWTLKKCLCLSLSERSRFSEGEIQTFMSVDVDRTINLCNSLHDAWRYIFLYQC
jgi:hypothetical protein